MSIKFDSVPNNIRKPGTYVEIHDYAPQYTPPARKLPPSWQANHEYHAIGPQQIADRVTRAIGGGDLYKCVVSGTSGSVEPTWPRIAGWQVIDGTVTWRMLRAG